MSKRRHTPLYTPSSLVFLLICLNGPVSARHTSVLAGGLPATRDFSATFQTGNRDYDRDNDGLIEVADLAQLDAMRYDLDGDGRVDDEDETLYYKAFPGGASDMGCPGECEGYELTADLDFDTNRNGKADPADTYWNDGAGWVPIGVYQDGSLYIPEGDPFAAVFEGNGHTIANLFIDRPEENGVGLFGYLRTYDAEVRNLGLSHVRVGGHDYVGGLAGIAGGVEHCHATGQVSGRDVVGGLAGSGRGVDHIRSSYAAVRVSGTGNGIGGLVGAAYFLESSYATGNVTGRTSVGGLVGYLYGALQASYATGRVSGQGVQVSDTFNCPVEGGVGGLVGTVCGTSVRASYATGRVTGETSAGGAFGTAALRTSVQGVYWDLDTSGVLVGVGSDDLNDNGRIDPDEFLTSGATGMTTTGLQTPEHYAGIYSNWNFDLEHDDDRWPNDPWDFGTATQYPALVADLDGDGRETWREFGYQLRKGPALTGSTSVGRAQMVLTWNAVDESIWTPLPEVTYTLIRDDADVDTVAAGNAEFEHTDTNVAAGAVYVYQVAVSVQGGEAARSARVPARVGAANQGPIAEGLLSERALHAGAEDATVEVSEAFRDPEGDTLVYAASSSAANVATVRMSGSMVRIKPIDAGQAMISVTATDSNGSNRTAVQRFRVTVWSAHDVDYDTDDDGLIEIQTLAQLDAMRHDLNGDGVVDGEDGSIGRGQGDVTAYAAAFPRAVESMGCGHIDGCIGYELVSDLDFDTNGNGVADSGDAYWNGGAGWEPIGGAGSTKQQLSYPFWTTFEGNGHIISNLFIDTDTLPFAALFGFTRGGRGSRCVIRHVGLINVDLTGDDYVAGLIGINWGCPVTGSYATGQVMGNMYVAGLVANNSNVITRSYSKVHVTGNDRIGGLVGANYIAGIIAACYATGRVTGGFHVGGLVGSSSGAIMASYATGRVTGRSAVGGLAAYASGKVTASYWDRNTSGNATGTSGRGLTTAQLQSPRSYSGIYRSWNLDLDGDGLSDDPWDFGTTTQYPVLVADPDGDGTATWQELGPQPRRGPNVTSSHVKGLAITSRSGPDATYAAGDVIEVSVTFNRAVEVTGTPRLTLDVGGRNRTAPYSRGAMATLVFSYTVVEGDSDTDGVSIDSNSLSLQGGTIRDASGENAVLDHGPLADDSDHQVDAVPPVFQRATVYGRELTLTYSETLDASSVPPPDAFTVSVGSSERTVTETALNRRTVTLALDPAVARFERRITVSYAVPSSNPIRDLAGNDAEPLSDAPAAPPKEDETGETVLDFAHFANGSSGGDSSITSDLVLVNVAPYSILPAVYFIDPEGELIEAEAVVDLTEDLEIREDGAVTVADAIPPLGELTLSTHGRGELTTGSVQVFADGLFGGVLRFDLPAVGVAGVGSSEPVRDAVFPARRRQAGINTGAAIRNPGPESLTVTCHLMRKGEVLAAAPIELAAQGQKARFIDERDLFGDWFTESGASDFTGSVRCSAPEGRYFTGVALEMDTDNRIFTTLPVVPVDESDQGRETTLEFAHFANGYSITSDLVLVNVSTSSVAPAVFFFDPDGVLIDAGAVVEATGELEVSDDGVLSVGTKIEPLGELTISTNGRGEPRTGSVRVVAPAPLGGVLRFNVPTVGVAGVGAGAPVEAAVFPARRQEDGINTGAAIRNPESEAVTVVCRLMKNGRSLDATRIDLEPSGQTARFIDEPDLFGEWFRETGTTDFTGSVHCSVPEGRTFIGVALEMDPENRIFTTLPVVESPSVR